MEKSPLSSNFRQNQKSRNPFSYPRKLKLQKPSDATVQIKLLYPFILDSV
jgi:hypothetical protein